MNFTPFGGSFPLHQFTTSSLVPSTVPTSPVPIVTTTIQQPLLHHQTQDTTRSYHNSTINMTHFNQPLVTTTTTIPTKFRTDDSIENKYNGHLITSQEQYTTIPYTTTTQQSPLEDKRLVAAAINYPQSTIASSTTTGHIQTQPQEISQDICNALLQQQPVDTKRVVLQNPSWQALTPSSTVADYLSHLPASTLPLSLHHFLKYSAENIKKETQNVVQTGQTINLNSLGSITIPQHQIQQTQIQQHQPQQQQNQVPQQAQSQQQNQITCQPITTIVNTTNNSHNIEATSTLTIPTTSAIITTKTKKKKRRKPPKERKQKPKPGEIRLTTALDGGLLYMCPECQVAYPERALLEVHLVGHNLERRFICEICNAALKRKDHLTRHKQSHNPERPFICTVCLKAFKRKEQLSLHFVIHSGEKRHICMECGKGFYRKDHLRKHTRSHIARRVKAELTLQNQNGTSATTILPQLQTTQVVITTIQQQPTSSNQQNTTLQQQNQQVQQHQIQIQQHAQQNGGGAQQQQLQSQNQMMG